MKLSSQPRLGVRFTTVKFPRLNRKLSFEFRNHMGVFATGFEVLPFIRVNNWMPEFQFYHVTCGWLCWHIGLWWQKAR